VVAFDGARDGVRQPPAPRQHAPHERVVNAKLAALALYPFLRRHGLPLDLLQIARIGLYENELADVVQQRGGRKPVTRVVLQLSREAVTRKPRGARVQPKTVGNLLPDRGALEEVESLGPVGDRMNRPGREDLDRTGHAFDLPAVAPRQMVR
jgi:hypothetical protein